MHDREVYWQLSKPANEAKLTNTRIEKLVGIATTGNVEVVRGPAELWGA